MIVIVKYRPNPILLIKAPVLQGSGLGILGCGFTGSGFQAYYLDS